MAAPTDVPGPGPLTNAIELTYLLARKTFKVRYKSASLGVVWAVLQPAIQAAVLAFVFSRVIGVGRAPHYPEYVLSGIFGWSLFSQSLSSATTSIVDNDSLVKKVALPKAVFPLSSVGATVLASGAAIPILVIGSIAAHTASLRLLVLPLAMIAVLALATGVSLVTSSLYVAYRDVRYLVESGLLLGLYVTPVIFEIHQAGKHLSSWLRLNPMTGALDLYRYAVLGREPDGVALAALAVALVLFLGGGALLFRSRADEFPDLL